MRASHKHPAIHTRCKTHPPYPVSSFCACLSWDDPHTHTDDTLALTASSWRVHGRCMADEVMATMQGNDPTAHASAVWRAVVCEVEEVLNTHLTTGKRLTLGRDEGKGVGEGGAGRDRSEIEGGGVGRERQTEEVKEGKEGGGGGKEERGRGEGGRKWRQR